MSYSAGDIAAGQMLLDWDDTTSPALYDSTYVPDGLDAVSADAAADGMIYSFYGRLSVASKDVAQLRAGNLPPTYRGRRPYFRHSRAADVAGVHVSRSLGFASAWPVSPGFAFAW